MANNYKQPLLSASLAISAREAIRDAVAAFGDAGQPVELRSPATPEAILEAIGSSRGSRQG